MAAALSFSCIFIWLPPKISASRRLTPRAAINSSRQDLFAAEPVDHLLDHLDSEAGARGRKDPTLDMLERPGHQIVLHGIAQGLQFKQLAGGRIERNRQAGR